jgi:hypothetical protein
VVLLVVLGPGSPDLGNAVSVIRSQGRNHGPGKAGDGCQTHDRSSTHDHVEHLRHRGHGQPPFLMKTEAISRKLALRELHRGLSHHNGTGGAGRSHPRTTAPSGGVCACNPLPYVAKAMKLAYRPGSGCGLMASTLSNSTGGVIVQPKTLIAFAANPVVEGGIRAA